MFCMKTCSPFYPIYEIFIKAENVSNWNCAEELSTHLTSSAFFSVSCVIFDTKVSFYTFSNFQTHTDEFSSSLERRQADPSTAAYDSLDFV